MRINIVESYSKYTVSVKFDSANEEESAPLWRMLTYILFFLISVFPFGTNEC